MASVDVLSLNNKQKPSLNLFLSLLTPFFMYLYGCDDDDKERLLALKQTTLPAHFNVNGSLLNSFNNLSSLTSPVSLPL